MAMSKKDFIVLADCLSAYNYDRHEGDLNSPPFNRSQINRLADFCQSQNANFNRERWLDYIAGKCGPSGGSR